MRKLLFFLFVLVSGYAVAQPKCGFESMHAKLMQQDPQYLQKIKDMHTQWSGVASNPNALYNYNGYGTEYIIPVVVHVIHTGGAIGTIYNPADTVIENAIEYLNEVYAATYSSYPDTNNGGVRFPVKFVLAKRNTSCGYTTGINRVDGSSISGYSSNGVNAGTIGADEAKVKALSRWDSRDYYNIWVVNKIDGKDGTSGSFTAGYAYFPGATDTIDGTIILATQMKTGKGTLTHEMGHAFNLYHTFEGDNGGSTCPTNNNCSTDGDEVCDTDPHKRNASTCPADNATNPCTSLPWSNNYTHKNIMDYSSCRDRFTAGQRTRWLYALVNYRPGLASSWGGVDTSTNVASASCSTSINSGNAGNTFNIGPTYVGLNDLTSNSGGYNRDHFTNYIDRTCQQRANVIAGKSYTLTVKTETNKQRVQVYLDTNNNGSFSSGELIYDHTGTISGDETHSTTYTIPTANIKTCTPLRMRVLADYFASSAVSNGCGTQDYGQAEDFTVYVKPASDTVTITNSITSGSNPACTGSSVTFTAAATKSLTSPSYQWYVNSQPVSGATNTTYTKSSLANGTYYVQCKVKYTATCGGDSAFSNIVALTVSGSSVTPSVSIASDKGTSICNGANVTFTATPTNGGTSPAYQWRLNGANVGTSSTTYANSSLSNNDVITCKLTNNDACASPDTAISNTLTMTVNSNVTPSVSIASDKGISICSSTSVTFTATPTNGGTTPAYQWRVNGANVGTNSSTYINSSLANNDAVTCKLTSNATCASPDTAISNTITMGVTTTVTPSVSIVSDKGTSICSGTSVTFTATPTNGGTTPTYQWRLNGVNVGTNSSTYANSSLSNGDIVTCKLTSNATCAIPDTAISNTVTMTVTTTVTPSVSIASDKGSSICTGDNVTFTATPTNGGSTPAYQWRLNGANVGTNSTTYANGSLSNGDVVTCKLTSNATCASPDSAISNNIAMNVSGSITPTVSIASDKGTSICNGTSVTFTATPNGGGSTPAYQWRLNGANVGTNSATYANSSLSNNDAVTCKMTSSATCASPDSAISNTVTMAVSSTVTPSVSIASDKGTAVCNGTTVTFTATPTNGGNTPAYQWRLNGANVGTNSATYANSSLSNGDVVTCKLTSNASCASPDTAISNSLNMSVSGNVTPSVTISSSKGTSACPGENVTFTPSPVNSGASPTYKWKVNGSIVSTGGTYSTTTLTTGDKVWCVLTSNAACAVPDTANSDTLTMTIAPNQVPAVSISSNKGTTICNNDSVTFTAAPTNGGATPSYQWKVNGVNAGVNSNKFITTSLSNGDTVSCVMKSSSSCASPDSAISNKIIMTVNPNLTPVIAISLTPNDTICDGTKVTFSATIANGGSVPAYQWKINGTNVGTNSDTFSSSTLSNNDTVTCMLTSSETCVTSPTAVSNSIIMTVNPILTPSVTTIVIPNDTICAGTSTSFVATPTNGGTSPTYQWKVNGTNAGTNNPVYTTTGLANGDVVSVIMTSSEACVSKMSDTSSPITMTVNPVLTPSVTVAVSPNDTICAGTAAIFIASPQNGGTGQSFQWKLNGSSVGVNSPVYVNNTLNNGDVITCVLTSTETCVTKQKDTSDPITMTVNPIITPQVTVTAVPNDTVCQGTNVIFVANAVNGGTSPSYQWKLNGFNVGIDNDTFSSSTLSTGDVITCELTSNGVCLTKTKDTSDPITMTIIPNVTPVVVITHIPNDTVCAGTNIKFTATIANGGASPMYQWQVNGSNVGTNSSTYNTTTLNDGDLVTCILTSSITCVTQKSDTSNAIKVNVNAKKTPDITITASPNDTICAGTAITFTASITTGGTSPTYQWRLNGTGVGTNSNTYMTTTLNDGDVIDCILTSSDTCVTRTMDTSNSIKVKVKPIVTPDVTITVSPNDTICDGSTATFTATAVNGGTSPTYQWMKNGVPVGTNSDTYASSTLSNSDVVSCILTTSETCVTKTKDTSNSITITVMPNVTPDVTISSVIPNDTICAGTAVIFTASPTNGGTSPTYQWQVNGANAGSNNNSFATASLADGDVVRVILTSSEMCVTKSMDTSTGITMKVNPNLTPDVTITVSPNDTICDGTSVTFTATGTNGGTSPTYQWQLNGTNVGTNSTTYTNATLADGDVVRCILTSSETCVTKAMDTSNVITMKVNPNLTPDVTITVSPNDTVCDGTSVTFTATPTNGGTSPTYQWRLNGTNVGTNSNMYTTTTLANNDVVDCILTSSEVCVTRSMDTSNSITMTVNPNVTPDVTITVSPNDTVCKNTIVTFTATATNEGTSPVYQWKINGSNVGINSNTYTTNSLADGDVVTCVLTSSITCVTKTMDTSNAINMSILQLTSPSLSISANPGTTICKDGEVTFNSNFSNGGTAQTYQWRLNGADISGATNSSYTTSTLASGDVISCKMNITAVCPDPDSALSNTLTMLVQTPSISISVSPDDTICDNNSAVFTVTGTNLGANPLYQWKLNGVDQIGVTGNVFTMPTVSHGDIITTEFTGSDNCVNAPATASANDITMTVRTTAAPSVGIAANPGTVLSNGQLVWFTSSVNAANVQYQWRKNGVDIPGANGIVYTETDPKDGDSIQLWIKVIDDTCRTPDTAVSSIIVLSVGVGVQNVPQEVFDNVTIAPNPNNGTFVLSGTIANGLNEDKVSIEIMNGVGAVVYREEVMLHNNELKQRIELGDDAKNGLHLVRITAGNRIQILKFIANR